LLVGEPDVGMAPEALREHAGGLHRRRVVEIMHSDERADREPPRPASALWVVLGNPDNLDDSKHRLPDGGVEDRELADLNRRALRGRVRVDLVRLDCGWERVLAATADQKPVRQTRSTTPAIAWPKPMHMHAMP
jgi:hypothetical protein